MKHAPSYFEHNAGQPQLHVPEASRDIIEFTPEPGIYVQEWVDMTDDEREEFAKKWF